MVGAQQDDQAGVGRIGQVIGNRWTLGRVIGTGGMATVYEAQDASGIRAAVKILHPDMAMNGETRSRFEREVAVTSQIDHPGIVRVIDQNAASPYDAYIAMELLEGQTLGERVGPDGRVPLNELLSIIEQVLDALAQAHDKRVVHRDLKPDNLFVTTEGEVKLLDFGVARLTDPNARTTNTRTGLALGTATYMAPEQALGKRDEIDARTDIFAIGAILFRLLSGRRVHEATTDGELLSAMATKPAPAFATVVSDAQPSVAAIIDVALSFNRASRYPDARTMQRDIRAVLDGKPPPFASSSVAASEQATVAPGNATNAQKDHHAPDLVGQVVAGRYRVEALLGSGGMGAVFRAEHVHMRKAVALKVLHREMTFVPEVVARFEREAIAAARIEHPNVAAATDFGKLEDGSFYLVLEYVEGHSLCDLLQSERALSPARAAHIARQIAQALAAAHTAEIVHRDLKPDNVMLVERGDNPDTVKVLDFGIAKVTAADTQHQPALTQLGSIFGTPEYMSPEQAMGQPVDARTDLYSLGIMLHEMLSGQGVPFEGSDMMATLTKQMTQPPPPLPPTVPPDLAAITSRLLAKRPEDRFQTADEVVTHLEQLDLSGALAASVHGTTGATAYSDTVYNVAGAAPHNSQGPGYLTNPEAMPLPVPAVTSMGQSVSHQRVETSPWQRNVQVARRTVPIWLLGAISGGALVFGFALVLVFATFRGGGKTQDSTALPQTASAASSNDEESSVLGEAEQGNETALKALKDAAADKGVSAWRALGLGLTRNGDYEGAVAAHSQALRLDPELATDPKVLADVRVAAEQPSSWKQAQDLATTMRSSGADVLYDVWVKLRNDRNKPGMAKEAKARLDKMSDKSEALKIALDLEKGTTCISYKQLMPRAIQHSDTRSLVKLQALAKPTLCTTSSGVRFGRLSLGKKQQDCWACLRGDDQLQRALKKAKSTPSPQFGAP